MRICRITGTFVLLVAFGNAVAEPQPTQPVTTPVTASALNTSALRGLAANCVTCHVLPAQASAGAILTLAGLERNYLYAQMKQFKTGQRESTLMAQILKGLDEGEMDALAEYFSRQRKPGLSP